jgi:hypothetical protein
VGQYDYHLIAVKDGKHHFDPDVDGTLLSLHYVTYALMDGEGHAGMVSR